MTTSFKHPLTIIVLIKLQITVLLRIFCLPWILSGAYPNISGHKTGTHLETHREHVKLHTVSNLSTGSLQGSWNCEAAHCASMPHYSVNCRLHLSYTTNARGVNGIILFMLGIPNDFVTCCAMDVEACSFGPRMDVNMTTIKMINKILNASLINDPLDDCANSIQCSDFFPHHTPKMSFIFGVYI